MFSIFLSLHKDIQHKKKMEEEEEENEVDRKMSGLGFLPLQSLPLGFRFHPTDEELINHYLKGKIRGRLTSTEAAVIPEVDLRRSEPWDLPELSPIRSADSEWFFFAAIDRKYPNGGRSNRATAAGYWKATGKDRSIKSKNVMVGMKKTLVFHTGRAPKGLRSNWIMHEYRVIDPEPESGDQGGFVLCRLFKKSEERIPSYTDDEIERSDFSATPIQFSPENMLRDAGVLEESATPQNQEFLESDKQPLADATDNQKSGIRSEMTDRTDGSIATLLKPEESHCISNITSDIGDYEANAVAPWLNDFYIRPIPGTDYDYPVLSSVHYVSQEPHHRSQDEMEKQDLIEFSDSLIKDTDSPEVANFETETATEVVPNGQVSLITHGSSRDLVSGKHRDMSNDLDTEAFIAQEGLTREDSGQLIRIPFSSSNSLEMNTSSGCNEIKPEFSIVYENPSPLLKSTGLCNNNWGFKMEIPWSESSLSLNLVGDMEESIDQANTTGSGIMIGQHKHPVNQPASIDYTAQQSTASERPLYINGTGMEIRRRQHSDAASTSSVYPTQQGMAARRTRLQCSTSTEGPTISEDLDSNEDEEEVNLATTKDEEHAKNQIMADWDSCFLQDCYDDTVSMEVNTTCKEMLEGPVPRPIADTEIKLEGSSLNHETSRIWRLSVIAALIIVPLCVGISIFLTA